MTNYRKKLIEVSLPLEAINKASAKEKSIRHGHPSTLHLWWARRPLATCRAVLFASLVDDPESDPDAAKLSGETREQWIGQERSRLHRLIEEMVPWENSNNAVIIRAARTEIARCVASLKVERGELKREESLPGGETVGSLVSKGRVQINAQGIIEDRRLPNAESVNAFLEQHAPPVLDPFCGGGSIPLEAQRLGLRAYGSDLNPVAVLITKALIEIPPKFAAREPINPAWQAKSTQEKALVRWEHAQGLAEDVRYYGRWMRDEAEKRIGKLYPKVKITQEMTKDRPDLKGYVGQELTVIAWLWARTIPSPNPACHGAHVPLVRSYWLSTKKGKEVYVRPVVDHEKKTFRFEVRVGMPEDDFDPRKATVVRRGAACLLTAAPISFDHVRAEGKAGRMRSKLMAIVAGATHGRVYLPPDEVHAQIAESADPHDYPVTDLPKQALSMRVMLYGMDKHYKLFTPRQLVALTTLSDLVQKARERMLVDSRHARAFGEDGSLVDGGKGPDAYSDSIATYLGFGVSKTADYNSNLVSWITQRDQARSTFSKQALPMIWDYCEVNPFAHAAGDPIISLDGISEVIESLVPCVEGSARQLAASSTIKNDVEPLLSTDPPYYDNIGYADLSDFFYVWLRRSLKSTYPSLFATALTPKAQELIATPYRHDGSREKAQAFFENGLGQAFIRMKEAQTADFPLTVYYAFKQSETEEDDGDDDAPENPQTASTGWETMLVGLIRSGFSITGTWPVRTERTARSVSLGTNALASSIVLVSRPRSSDASLATRKEFMNALRRELPDALKNLQSGNIAPVDLAQATIGPGMAVFTRYGKVIESDGSPMTVRTALGIINQVLDEVLADQEGEFDADTRWALAWFDQYGAQEGPFGDAETFCKAKNTAINGLVEAGVVKAKGGKVQLTGRSQLPKGWDPTRDKRLTVWETTQHLIRTLENDGEPAAAALMNKLGGVAETARDLAYRLYAICERKKWAEEALAYNGLVIAWPELTKLARSQGPRIRQEQGEFF
ncbi:MAG: DUF1156 domain-containing protein [Isosphaeraceae bacterium]|jgi:putative DNA methylase